ncbi:MAG: iron-sulfur cluster assembly scaffold protein [Steroidobacteraceae bacterium]
MPAKRDPPETSPDYSDLVVEHFHHPRNAGGLPAGSDIRRSRAGNRTAGAEVSFSVRIEDDAVAEVRFQAFGCPHFLAAASLATERLKGLPVAALVDWTAREIGQELAVPVEKRGRLLILEDAVRAAAQ